MSKGTVNKVIILGRLGQDPDVRTTASGTKVVNLNVATNHGIRDAQGNWSDATEWHRCVVFGKTADAAAQYLSKGSSVYLEGRLQTRKWQDQATGQDRYSTEVVCNEMQFIGGRDNQMGGGAQAPQQDPWGTPAPQPQQQSYQQPAAQPQMAPQPAAAPQAAPQPMAQPQPAAQPQAAPQPMAQPQAGGMTPEQQQQRWQQAAPQQAAPQPAQSNKSFDDFDDDIPF